MLIGLALTIYWIPSEERNPDTGEIKTLEELADGLPQPNGFTTTWLARWIEMGYHKVVDWIMTIEAVLERMSDD